MTKTNRYTKGALLALTVAGMFGCASSDAGSGKSTTPVASGGAVQCEGLNACKGQGSCRGNENACKAKNSCKGKGWVEVPSAAECTQRGGTLLGKS